MECAGKCILKGLFRGVQESEKRQSDFYVRRQMSQKIIFELNEEKWTYNDFCVVVISIVQDRNRDGNLSIECTRRRSKDGKNHFWLLRK